MRTQCVSIMDRQHRCWEIHCEDVDHDRHPAFTRSLSWIMIWCSECAWSHQDIAALRIVSGATR